MGENLSYDLHSRRELAEDDHHLYVCRKLKAGVLEVGEVAEHLCNGGSGMGASRDRGREEPAELGIGIPDTGGAIVLLEVVPDLLHHSKVGDGGLDGRGHTQGDVAEGLFIVLIP